MWFRLALALGMSVARAQEEISAVEFAEWCAYYSLDPFGTERGDHHAAIVAATIANVNRGRGQQPFSAGDFMPDFDGSRARDKATTDAEKDERMFNDVLAAFAGRIVDLRTDEQKGK